MTPPADIWGTPKFMTNARIQMPKPKKKSSDTGVIFSGDDTPLYLLFDGKGADGSDTTAEFGGGGAFSGGGGGSSWGDASNSSHGAATGSSGDGGDGGGGSSCSSSCGGGE